MSAINHEATVRIETALSRYPLHHLSKAGGNAITLREGEVRWEVKHSPGPLGYRLDTLIVSRKLEQAGRPVPRLVRLGSLSEICRDLGLVEGGKIKADVKRALFENAAAFIMARITYRTVDGVERTVEFGTTRYAVVLTGETLPDGRRADAVYLVLTDLDTALTRPLDYGYLRELPPITGRWYELASFVVFGALKHRRPTARLGYGEFCAHAPQTRYTGSGPMRKQMAKVHAPHLESGYLAGVAFEATTDHEGRPDWMMAYTPGPKARAEYRAFTGKGGPVLLDVTPTPSRPEPQPEPTGLVRELVDRGVTRSVAAELVRDFPADRITAQLERLDWLRETKPKRVKDLGAYLVGAIREDYAAPAGFEGRAGRAAREAAERAALEREAEARKSKAREREAEDRVRAYREALPPERRAALEAEALAGADPADRAAYAAATATPVKKMLLTALRDALIRQRLGLPAVS
jgi:hypothetical protein